MGKAVILALIASMCTAVSSVCQRIGASQAPVGKQSGARLMWYLVRQPVWLAGIASMILGFGFQITALHYGSLALVQPILATELLFVFACIAVIGSRPVRRKDWLATAAMAVGLGVFLFTASPSRGHTHAPGILWWLAGISTLGLAVVVAAAAYTPLRRGRAPSPARRAAALGVATGISWGFLAAVIKELSSHTNHGVAGIFSTWSPYVLVVVGAATMLLASHALQAGTLAASQPGFTLADPLVASLLGVFVFRDHLQLHPADIAIEIIAVLLLVGGVITLSHSQLVHGEFRSESSSADPLRSARWADRIAP